MIVCHCLHITDRDIHAAIDWMRAADAHAIITPGKIYHALGKRADCGGCMPLFLSTMRKNANLEVPMELRGLRESAHLKGNMHERRRKGN
ncbi:(2Fe-2S)-binding protein [Paenirhodobacter populi]|uniref:(2Fe-2S)-binding protein n=1 Tax=Paenirhodobacter populi TaxID=2306993 RepID=A0A443IUD1_9RHOB|nr:(2Fe-2S)-binding protein [Sinirhodobacter populi]RWR06490.1 (2Fe-2S)-binding protein [Sinirhodobacter populi]RWR11696.1 (2Fe-2S)-binding protein [Sinirhodobacter populi]RWR17596.1 (2Fe-2S)-binding protein [Sinirhodobacter populi]RWR29357.1 (2Fe-2S)-binding protein [Sinirhodobacter populi]